MPELKRGEVAAYRAVTKRTVHLELKEQPGLIELTVADAWALGRGDTVSVSGRSDRKTGKFIAYAYRNHSKGVIGAGKASVFVGLFWIAGGFVFLTTVVIPLVFFTLGGRELLKKVRCRRSLKQIKDVPG